MSGFFHGGDGEQIEQSHANGNAVGDLFEDAGLRAVGDFGGDLDAAHHGTGVENDGVWVGPAETLSIELVEEDVIVGGKRGFVEALGLDAEDDDDVGVF